MKVTWLGQAGLLFETNGIKIMSDPYLSDSVEKVNPRNFRRVPVDERFLQENVDVIVLTHNHLDHLDPETLESLLDTDKTLTVLAPYEAWQEVRKFGKNHNYVMFNRGTVWTQNCITFTAVKAEHSDLTAIGFIIDDGKERFYVTGDTLYNKDIFADLPNNLNAVFLPINGEGNNMNVDDAKRFAKETRAKKAVPVHWGMFDEMNGTEFGLEKAVIPKIYEEIEL